MSHVLDRSDSQQRLGMVAMIVAMGLLPVGDAISKLLTEVAAPFDVSVWRITAQAICFVPVALWYRRQLSGRVLSVPAALSALCISTVMVCLISAFRSMPIATAIAIFFVEPLLLTLLSWPLLGERPGPRRFVAVGLGLIGALIVIRPNFAAFGPVALFPLMAALAYALNMVVLRRATRTRPALAVQIGATFIAAAGMLAVSGLGRLMGREGSDLVRAEPWVWLAVVSAGALAALTFLLIAHAFSKAEASHLAPLQYLEIVGATLVGLIVFGEFPDALTWLGTAIILASGIYVFRRERIRADQS